MFDHVTLRATDAARTARLLTAPMAALGLHPEGEVEFGDLGYYEGAPTRNLHVGLVAATAQTVNAFWQAGVDAGLQSDGAPGPRPAYGPGYYGGFLLDPDGNSIEACVHPNVSGGTCVDHVWMRVRDLAVSRAFYEAISEWTGFAVERVEPGRVQFRGPKASLSILEGTPVSENVHLAFPGASTAVVDAFHAAALAHGAPDNGGPGERPGYHPGYYGAFVLDPDGHNVEVVRHR